MKKHLHLFVALILLVGAVTQLHAQGTAFTYQGRLTENGVPANGANDFTFTLYDSVNGGAPVGASNVVNDFALTNGFFTVALDFGASFDGSARWLQIAVRPGASAEAYTNLTPRQAITTAPYALRALNAGNASSATTAVSMAADGVNNLALAADAVDGTKILNGSITSADLNASLLNGTFWNLGGNAGTTAGTHFLGTMDNQPLEFKVNGLRALRIEDIGDSAGDSGTTPDGAPNLIGGSPRNFVGASVVGATIAGGGATNYSGFAYINSVLSDFGVVGGGRQNTIAANSFDSVIGGGNNNSIAADSYVAIIAGGANNTIEANSFLSVIAGGADNKIAVDSFAATIAGGIFNDIGTNSDYSIISGGRVNTIAADSSHATFPGGDANSATNYAFAAGRRAKANHTGTFVWGDSFDGDVASTADNQFTVRASGGAQFFSNTAQSAGVSLAAGGTA